MTKQTIVKICDVADVVGPRGLKVVVEGVGILAVFQFEGAFYVVDDKCTHGLGSLSQGKVTGNQVICAFHRGAFNFITGEPTVRPCNIPLKTYATELVGTAICIAGPANAT